jgi:hypothetical protein
MKTLEAVGEIGEDYNLRAALPEGTAVGTARVVVLLPEQDRGEDLAAWSRAVAREWRTELRDTREDIYTLQDGEPVDAAG